MSALTGLFNLLALLYIGRAAQLLTRIIRDWQQLRQEPLTGAKQHLAEQAAFFIAVPVSVLLHEAAHAAAVLLFGGRVAEFGYRVFWGYVVPEGSFTAAQQWVIAVAGTLGSLGFGVAVWLLLRGNASRTLQYFGRRAFRFQIYFSLLYYPIFTLFLPIGDWRTIYDFRATPVLSGMALAAHAAALLWFWRADRAGAFEMPAFETLAEQQRYMTLNVSPDPLARLATVQMLRRGGASHRARRALDAFLVDYPHSAEAQLQRALLLADGRGTMGRESAEAARRAVSLGLQQSADAALARRVVALYELERGDGEAAALELDAALTPAPAYDPDQLEPPVRAELHHLRSQAYRRQGRYEDAYRESGRALEWAAMSGQPQLVERLRDEQLLIEKHAGRPLAATGAGNSGH